MSDNVIILGAGFSSDAGIPTLSNFIERMWEYSIRGAAGSQSLDSEDKEILANALKVRSEMDGYHGRVSFDDRNIEDILSMLVFNLMGGKRSDKKKLDAFISAISKTIELSCNVKHPGLPKGLVDSYQIVSDGAEIYRRFWKALFRWYGKDKSLPTIITFNYDLVLERSFLQVLINKYYDNYNNRVPFKQISLDYQYKYFPKQTFDIEYARYGHVKQESGTILKLSLNKSQIESANIEILKLHGSLNFPINKAEYENNIGRFLPVVIKNPCILPPVSNKQSNGNIDNSWAVALQRLREAKNVVFVGYSLPKTDMYMQFFLKAALGPNQDLDKLYIFDPVLWEDSQVAADMKSRYEQCFSEQLRSRLIFKPTLSTWYDGQSRVVDLSPDHAGKTEHFVRLLEFNPGEILF